jgi:hypothetical protein
MISENLTAKEISSLREEFPFVTNSTCIDVSRGYLDAIRRALVKVELLGVPPGYRVRRIRNLVLKASVSGNYHGNDDIVGTLHRALLVTRHLCSICGQPDPTRLEHTGFRYCRKCEAERTACLSQS